MTTTTEVNWHGNPVLEQFLVPVEELKLHPNNPRRGDLPTIAGMLDHFGQVHPIVVREGVIVAGNHRYKAATEILGWTHIAAIDATHLSADEMERFLIGDNRSGDKGTYDDAELSSLLARMMDEGRLEGTGWTPDEAEDYLASLKKFEEAERQTFGGGFLESPQEKEERAGQMRHAENLRDITLIYEESVAQQFAVFVRMLKHAYGTTGIADTVFKAVENAARAL